MFQSLKEIYNYREMLQNMVKRDLRTRYKGSALGFLWTFIKPLFQLVIYSVVFSLFLKMNVDKYPMYLFVALLPWIYFASTTQAGAKLVVQNANLIKKVYFPREILPLSSALAGLINLSLSLLLALGALILYGIPLTISLLALPLVMAVHFIFTLGVTFIISSLNVYYRDTEHMWDVFIMAWFYLTPIVYPPEKVPEQYIDYVLLNPAALMVEVYRDILYRGVFPDAVIMAKFVLMSFAVCFIGFLIFKHLQRGFAEEI